MSDPARITFSSNVPTPPRGLLDQAAVSAARKDPDQAGQVGHPKAFFGMKARPRAVTSDSGSVDGKEGEW